MRSLLFLVAGLSLSACAEPVDPEPDPEPDGVLAVSTSTVGADPDPDGFRLTVDGVDSLALAPSGTAEVKLAPGRHTLELLGVAEHCVVAGGTSVVVDIAAGRTTPAAFYVLCPGTRIVVAVTTTGLNPDHDGHLLTIDGVDSLTLDPAENARDVHVAPGRHRVELLGVAEHCSVAPPTVLELDFARGSTTPLAFVVDCPLTGARITVTTTGVDFDPNGYSLVVDDSARAISSNDTVLVELEPRNRTIDLTGLAPNCALDGPGLRTVSIVATEVVTVEFVVVCTATSGVIGVVIADGIRRGHVAQLDGGPPRQVPSTGILYLTRVSAGQHLVSLSNPFNCSVSPGPQRVTVTTGDTVEVRFSVTCEPASIRVTVPTTGIIPRGDFSVYLCDPYYCDYYVSPGHVVPNGTLLAPVEPGRYRPGLSNVPRTCRREPAWPEILVVAGAVTSVELPLVCE
jgi:hypothetical protein